MLLAAAAAGCLPSGRVRADDNPNQAYFAIEAETSDSRAAGLPKIQLPTGIPLPAGITLPPEVRDMLAGSSSRKLSMRLWSPTVAPDGATAAVIPPAGLGQGPRLDLVLYRPKPGDGAGSTLAGNAGSLGSVGDFTMKFYWGSSKTVRPGQPKIVHVGDLTGDQKAQAEQAIAHAKASTSYFYKPGWTTGYWPTKDQPGKIDDAAALPGTFIVKTNYTGVGLLSVPPDVNFLDKIALTSPDLSRRPDLTQGLPLAWNQIPGLLGMYAIAVGMEGNNTAVIWSSSEVEAFPFFDNFLEMAQVRKFVEDQVFMAGDRSACDIPAGIFANADMATLRLVGWGKGAARDNSQPLPRLQTKTTLNVLLGGKLVAAFAGFGGFGGFGR
jgi:hypothetical protein